jgi:hypothetical protein
MNSKFLPLITVSALAPISVAGTFVSTQCELNEKAGLCSFVPLEQHHDHRRTPQRPATMSSAVARGTSAAPTGEGALPPHVVRGGWPPGEEPFLQPQRSRVLSLLTAYS